MVGTCSIRLLLSEDSFNSLQEYCRITDEKKADSLFKLANIKKNDLSGVYISWTDYEYLDSLLEEGISYLKSKKKVYSLHLLSNELENDIRKDSYILRYEHHTNVYGGEGFCEMEWSLGGKKCRFHVRPCGSMVQRRWPPLGI